jgi:putative ABC transport system substrate-binding protein
MVTRRQAVIALGAGAFAPHLSFAQPSAKIFRIGVPYTESEAVFMRRGFPQALRTGLSELGYVEGKNLKLEFRFAESQYDRLDSIAAELVALKVDVIVTQSGPMLLAASRATKTIPIVMQSGPDVVAMGLVSNLARPGGNITGSVFFYHELNTKRLEIIKEFMPRITQVAVLLVRNSPTNEGLLKSLREAAKSLKVELQTFEGGTLAEIQTVFATMANSRVRAALVPDFPLFQANTKMIADLATQYRILSIGSPDLATAGAMVGYGVDFVDLYRRVGHFVDKIF